VGLNFKQLKGRTCNDSCKPDSTYKCLFYFTECLLGMYSMDCCSFTLFSLSNEMFSSNKFTEKSCHVDFADSGWYIIQDIAIMLLLFFLS